MKNADYWKRRFELIEAATNKRGERMIYDIEPLFTSAQKEIESQISTWYQRFAKNNQISLAEARKLLKTNELAELKWDIKEYIKHGEQNALNSAWMSQLENASARFHISRLEALQLQTQHTVEKLFGNQIDGVDRLLKKQYLESYYHTFYEVHKGFNIGWDIAAINENQLERLILKPWTADQKTFSDRILTDKTRLLHEVHTKMTHNIILGKSPDKSINDLAKALNTSKSNAGRLIMTESAYFSNLAQHEAYTELDVEQFEVIETLDSQTCEICGGLDGKVFPMPEFQAGVTAPPFHPWCRGCTVPFFEDDFGERAAKDNGGKTYYVPSDMKYSDWNEKVAVDKYAGIDYNKYMKAQSGGKNHGTFITLSEQTDEQLLRSIRSYGKNVAEHYTKISEPAAHVDNWLSRSDAYKLGIVKKWEKDIARNNEQLNIAKGIAMERGLKYE